MKTSILLFMLVLAATGCDSSVEPTKQQPAGLGSTFVFAHHEFDAGAETSLDSTTFTIDSINMAVGSRTDGIKAISSFDTIVFARNTDHSALIYRPEIELFDGISLPELWREVATSADTSEIEIGTYTGETILQGMNAIVTIHDRKQYLGTSNVTLNGKTYEVVSASSSVEVQVAIHQVGVTITTTFTNIYDYAPELGYLVSSKEIRDTDSQFSPIQPGKTELTLISYAIN